MAWRTAVELRNGAQLAALKRDALVTRLFQGRLQELLSAMAGLFADAAFQTGTVPAGFTGQFRQALTRPTLGGLHSFLVWASGQATSSALGPLAKYLQQNEKQPTGWLIQMVQHRNQWAHPREKAPAEVVALASGLLASAPEFVALGGTAHGSDGTAVWVSAAGVQAVGPFTFVGGEGLEGPAEFNDAGQVAFRGSDRGLQTAAASAWAVLRQRDSRLDDPTSAELADRARSRAVAASPVGRPEWLESLATPGPAGLLVDPNAAAGIAAHAPAAWPGSAVIDLALSGQVGPGEALASSLGLARAPGASLLFGAARADAPFIVIARADELTDREFLQAIYWVADVGQGGEGLLRLAIQRQPSRLSQDHAALWGHLPDRLESLLRRPPGSKGTRLSDFCWTLQSRKRWMGLF